MCCMLCYHAMVCADQKMNPTYGHIREVCTTISIYSKNITKSFQIFVPVINYAFSLNTNYMSALLLLCMYVYQGWWWLCSLLTNAVILLFGQRGSRTSNMGCWADVKYTVQKPCCKKVIVGTCTFHHWIPGEERSL